MRIKTRQTRMRRGEERVPVPCPKQEKNKENEAPYKAGGFLPRYSGCQCVTTVTARHWALKMKVIWKTNKATVRAMLYRLNNRLFLGKEQKNPDQFPKSQSLTDCRRLHLHKGKQESIPRLLLTWTSLLSSSLVDKLASPAWRCVAHLQSSTSKAKFRGPPDLYSNIIISRPDGASQ